MKNKKIKILIGIIMSLLIIDYFALIPLNIRYLGVFNFVIFLSILIYVLFSKEKLEKTFVTYHNQVIETFKPKKTLTYVLFGGLILIIINSISSSPLFFSKQYQRLIGEVEEKEFTTEFSAIETTQLPIIDHELALLLGDKKLGSERGLGSEFHVGNFTDISVNGKLVAVAPLEYNGFFKWLNNKGTPGYIIVDKVTGDVELVTELDDKRLSLEYMPSAYLAKDLKRHVYLNGHADNMLYSTSFELDDNGYPYWIISKTRKTIGINGGDDVYQVITVNAQTGEINSYKIEEAPSWIDMIYPKELVMKQLDDWGIYVNGFWNTIFGEKNIVHTTSGSRRVFNDNNVYHYTGLTSSGADESTVGFAFINTRNKATVFYGVTGATEEAAMASAEGKVQNLGYYATFPLPININDEPTFLITLKDSKGLIKQYAFVNITDYSIVGNGETIEKAKISYLKALGEENVLIDEEDIKTIKGKISRMGFDISGGDTTYYLVLEGSSNLYYASSNVSQELNISKIGDNVELRVNDLKIIDFNNLMID